MNTNGLKPDMQVRVVKRGPQSDLQKAFPLLKTAYFINRNKIERGTLYAVIDGNGFFVKNDTHYAAFLAHEIKPQEDGHGASEKTAD